MKPIYVEKSGSDLRMRIDNRYDIVGKLNPGDTIRILRCMDYPLSTTGGTHLQMEVIKGNMLGSKITNGIIFDYVVDTSGEAFAIPKPDILDRVPN